MLQLKCSWSCSCGCSCSSCSWSGVEVKLKRSRSCSCSGSVVEVVAVVWRSAVAAVYLSVYVYIYIYISLFIYLSFCLSIYPSISLSASLKTKQFCETSSTFELDNIKNEAILRDFLNFGSWQHQKRSNSARLPSKIGSSVQSWRPRTNAFCDFSTPPVSSTAPATKNYWKIDARFYEVLRLPPATLAMVFGNATKPSRFAHFWQGAQSLAPATQNDIWTPKSAPNPSVFYTFDFEMCFAPQRRTLFRHLNFQKCSEHAVLCTFWLGNVLRATTACTFSTSQLPKVVRRWCVLYILTWECASRHNGVQLFISHLTTWLRTRRFSEPTFRPSGATNHWKNSVSWLSYLFAHLHLLSSDSFSSLIFSLLLISALLFSDSSHLCCSICPYCRKFDF